MPFIVSVPAPDLVRSAPDSPAMIVPIVPDLPVATEMVPSKLPSVIPRFGAIETSSVNSSVPPFNVIAVARPDPGTAPRLRSFEIDNVPAETVVDPVCVFVADKVTVPVPCFVNPETGVSIGSFTVVFPEPSKVTFGEPDVASMALPLTTSSARVPESL